MIVKQGSNFVLKSKDGKKTLGTYKTKEEALKRLRQVEFWKSKAGKGK